MLSILRTRERKNSVSRVKEGRAHRHTARLGRETIRQRAKAALAQKFFRGFTKALLVRPAARCEPGLRTISAALDASVVRLFLGLTAWFAERILAGRHGTRRGAWLAALR